MLQGKYIAEHSAWTTVTHLVGVVVLQLPTPVKPR